MTVCLIQENHCHLSSALKPYFWPTGKLKWSCYDRKHPEKHVFPIRDEFRKESAKRRYLGVDVCYVCATVLGVHASTGFTMCSVSMPTIASHMCTGGALVINYTGQ